MVEVKNPNGGKLVVIVLAALCEAAWAGAVDEKSDLSYGDKMIFDYFAAETAILQKDCPADTNTLEEWEAKRGTYHKQLLEMLGLDPWPEKTDLKAQVTGKVEHEEFTVEKVQFQSMPGLYVTGNLYVPKNLEGPAPTVLYVCGHGKTVIDGVSYGNKVNYQHHAAWFARNGFVCLIIDTLQWGEILGKHHGTYSFDMWWWNSRGYTPAGVETWNCVRALDYLETRPEVDKERFGVTGRSGGGAYSWWVAAVDERIKAAVPVSGMTDLQNYVVDGRTNGQYPDGCVDGHCDCMFMVNTYRWDYPMIGALIAPRALLISGGDKDDLFPIEGVMRLHAGIRKIYRLYDADRKLGLNFVEGPHRDTQPLRIQAFSWFNQHLKNKDPLIETAARSCFEPQQLKVFDELPKDEINSRISETFTPRAETPAAPDSAAKWRVQRDKWLEMLKEKCFRGWPRDGEALDVKPVWSAQQNGIRLSAYDFTSQHDINLRFYLAQRAEVEKPAKVIVRVLTEPQWTAWVAGMRVEFAAELKNQLTPLTDESSFDRIRQELRSGDVAVAYIMPRGVGPTRWKANEYRQTHIRRRFMLLGQTLDGMRVWDVRRAIQAVRTIGPLGDAPLVVDAQNEMSGIGLYAALYEPRIEEVNLTNLPESHRDGPIFLNVLRVLDTPQTVAMVAENSRVVLRQGDDTPWQYAKEVSRNLGWPQDRVLVLTTAAAQ